MAAKKSAKPSAKKPAPKFTAAPSVESLLRGAAPAMDMGAAKEQMEKSGTQLFHGYEDMAQLNKENMEAAVKSSQILAKAAEQMGKAIAGFTQSSLELSAQAGQAMLGAKTLRDFVELQSEYAKNSFDHVVAGTAKISDMAVKVANEAIEPISQRVNEAVEKVSKNIAA